MAEIARRLALALPALALAAPARAEGDAWGFTFDSLDGGALPLAQFRGRVLLVVNTASFCGYTPQYAALQRLHDRHEARGLTVVGVPSADFNQEHRDNRAVRQFCDAMFGITFPMAVVTPVRGEGAHPFFRWAAAQAGPVRWNFHKYLVHRDGRRIQGFSTQQAPDGPAITRALEAALSA